MGTHMAVIMNKEATVRIGGMRRKTKRVSTHSTIDEVKLAAQLKSLGVTSIPAVEDAKILKTDGSMVRLVGPKVSVSAQSNTCVISAQSIEEIAKEKDETPADEPAEEVTAEGGDKDEEGNDDEETGDKKAAESDPVEASDMPDKHKPNKGEKKIRSKLSTFGLKPAQGYTEMRLRTAKGIVVVIKNPDVLKAAGSKGVTVACMGKIQMQDTSSMEAQARKLMDQIKASQPDKDGDDSDDEDCPELAEVTFDEQAVELGDLSEDDVKLVMDQSGVSRARAITTLRQNEGDVVNAVMALT